MIRKLKILSIHMQRPAANDASLYGIFDIHIQQSNVLLLSLVVQLLVTAIGALAISQYFSIQSVYVAGLIYLFMGFSINFLINNFFSLSKLVLFCEFYIHRLNKSPLLKIYSLYNDDVLKITYKKHWLSKKYLIKMPLLTYNIFNEKNELINVVKIPQHTITRVTNIYQIKEMITQALKNSSQFQEG